VFYPDNPNSVVVLDLAADQTVAIAVDGWDAASGGEFELHISQVGCDAPTDLGNALPVNESGDNTDAGDDVTPSCITEVGGEDAVYTWAVPADGFYAFDTMGSSFAAVVAVYDGTCGSYPNEIGCAVDGSEFSTLLAQGTSLSVVVDGATPADVGGFDLNITQTAALEGDCCVADASPACEDFAVTQCVCEFSDTAAFAGPFPDAAECCTGEWTDACASLAGYQCAAGCDNAIAGGSCCTDDSGEPGCDVPAVQDCVCAFDSYCCDTNWDGECALKAQLYCFSECA
jgi:hypothetical protein